MLPVKNPINGNDIDYEAIEKNFKYHVISIADNGIGFPQTESEKIFEMFYRLHEKNKYKGSGTAWHCVKRSWKCMEVLLLLKVSPMKALLFIVIFRKRSPHRYSRNIGAHRMCFI